MLPLDPADADPRFYKQNLSIYTNPADSCVDAASFNINRGILRGQQYGSFAEMASFKMSNGKMMVGNYFTIPVTSQPCR